MRAAARPVIPEFLAEHGAAWCKKYVEQREADPAYRFQWKQHQGQYVNLRLREPLSAMTQAHCAYCDGSLEVTSPPTIDHFLPKTHYPELVYAWANLYLACVMCQKEKARKFDSQINRVIYRDELLRPDELGYRFERYFLFNYQNGDIEPNPQGSALDQMRAKYTIHSLGLNEGGRPSSRKRTLRDFAKEAAEEANLDDWPYRFLLEPEL
jgi:uncharacterized protein (TIGR02646 family)